MIRNTPDSYGWLAIVLHWSVAIVVVGLFGLGLWMMDLDYTSQWYQKAPHWHKSIGVILVAVMLLRLIWRSVNPSPKSLENHKRWEVVSAKVVHGAFYVLIFLMLPTGYFITTAKGNSLHVFDWFSIPAIVDDAEKLPDIAGEIHEYIAFTIIGLASIHALGALKHHFFDKDNTLKRMLGLTRRTSV